MTRVQWAGNKEIAGMLDVSTGACTYCGGPARVPEDVAAVMEHKGEQVSLIVCVNCHPFFEERLRIALEQAKIDIEYQGDE